MERIVRAWLFNVGEKIPHPVEPSTLKGHDRRDRHVRQVNFDTGWGTEASQSVNPRPLRARKERDEQGQKGGGKKEDPVGVMQDGGRGLLKEDNIWRK